LVGRVFIISDVDIANLKTHQKTLFSLLTNIYQNIVHETHENFIKYIDILFLYFSIAKFKTVPQIGIHLVGMVLAILYVDIANLKIHQKTLSLSINQHLSDNRSSDI
jgi:hypothetical protein